MTDLLASVEDIAGHLSGGIVYVSGCAAEIPGLENLHLGSVPGGLSIQGIFLPGINKHDYSRIADNARCKTFFMTPQMAASDSNRVDYCPWRYREIIRYYQKNPVDVAVVMLSQPDANGFCSYGITSDFAPVVLPTARKKIGVINRQMPTVCGEKIAYSHLDAVVEIDQPLLQTRPAKIDEVSQAIARNIATYVDDGATLQLGLGSIPGAVTHEIRDRKNLKVLSGLIESSALELDAAGALCPDTPIVGGVALGGKDFYDMLTGNERVLFESVLKTHNVSRIASIPSFIAVNGALQVDVFGQVNSSVLPSGYMSGPGGLPEFVAGALASEGGRSIIALNASAKGGVISKIVPTLEGAQPSVSALDADVVVTEFGVAELRGKSVSERVQAMIAIADPAHREALAAAAGVVG